MTTIAERIARLAPEKRAELEKRLAESSGAKTATAPIEHLTGAAVVPSFGQERLWVLEQIDGTTGQYNISCMLRLSGNLNVAALKSALGAVIQRHETLRTRFGQSEGRLQLDIAGVPEALLTVNDFSGFDQSRRDEALSEGLHKEANRPFVLEREAAIRATLYRMDECSHVLQLTLHHAASDGWSMGILYRDLAAFYHAAVTGTAALLPDLPIAFSDFARWQREQLAGSEGERLISYWKDQVHGSTFALQLPTDRPRPALQTFNGAVRRYSMPGLLAKAINDFCSRERVTPFMASLAALYAVLARYTGQSDILIGSPVASRTRIETEELVGFFTNTVILRGRLDGDPTFRELLHGVRQTAMGAIAHQELPLELLIQQIRPERDLSRSALFQVMLVFQNTPELRLDLDGLETSVEWVPTDTSKFDFTIELRPVGEEIKGTIQYNTDLFDSETTDRLWGHFTSYLDRAIASPEEKVAAIAMLTPAERRQLVAEWNGASTEFPRDKCVHQLFEEQVLKTPDAAAVLFEDQSLSYADLNRRANQLAHYLRQLGVKPDARVAICVERGVQMIVSMLAVLKAGGAYVPLDPAYPVERLRLMLQDSTAVALITQSHLHKMFSPCDDVLKVVDLESGTPPWVTLPETNPDPDDIELNSHHLAYVIYTSGSTGQPKGVMVEHRSVMNLFVGLKDSVYVATKSPNLRVAVNGSIAFDTSVKQIIQLLQGFTLDIVPEDIRFDSRELLAFIRRRKINVLDCTPSQLRLLLDGGLLSGNVVSSFIVLVGGEAIDPISWKLMADSPHIRFFNLYGPTECTVDACTCAISPSVRPTIGRPIANTQVYILDALHQPVPVGVPGELCIGGAGVARGYLNRPELTEAVFLSDPFRSEPGTRVYKTGDMGRWQPDGTIELLGRNDSQVKIRGYRIELGEIEAALRDQPAIKQAVVIAREDTPGDKRLVAYLVTSPGELPATSEVRKQLKESLPDYMVPSAIVILDQLPISPNGKIDRKALPAPDAATQSGQIDTREFIPPSGPTEEKIAAIFVQVLQLPKVGAEDDFFDLGGHSLTATRVITLLNTEFGTALPVRVLFQANTVKQLASLVAGQSSTQQEGWPMLIPIQPRGSRPPLFCVSRPNVNALGYLFLSRELGDDQPVYGLQVQLPEHPEVDFTDEQISTTATEYIRVMKKVQPQGPYNFVGLCQGAYIAFEMVRQLESVNERASFIGILDTWPDENTRYKSFFFADLFFTRLRKMDGKAVAKALDKIHSRRSHSNGSNRDRVSSGGPVSEKRMVQKYWPGRDFHPPVCSCPITVFKVRKQFWFRKHDEALGWSDRTRGGVKVRRVPGDHGTLLRQPHVRELAAMITEELNRTCCAKMG